MKRILIVDEQPVRRSGLRQWLSGFPQTIEVCEAENADQAISKLIQKPCDVIILDLDLEHEDGVELIKRIRRQDEGSAILVFTAHSEHRYGVRALRAGALGYLSKRSSEKTLLFAVQRTLDGHHFISRELSERLAQQITGRHAQLGYEALSDREYQITSMIARGLTASRIASNLNLSAKTVHTHRSRALKKLGLQNSAELMHYAFRNRLVD